MNILQVIPFFTPVFGGSVTIACQLSKELAKRGHNVTILTTDFEYDENYVQAILQQKGISVVKFHCVINLKMFLISPNIKMWLNNNINNYDIIHMHNFRSYQNNIIHHYAMKYNVPYVLQAHGSVPRIIEKQSLKKVYDIFWGNRLIKDASKLIAVSNVEVEQYIQMGADINRISKIPNGLDINKLNNQITYGEFRKEHNISGKHLILFLGRIHKIKGVDFLIKAFKGLLEDKCDAQLVIVGPDDGYKCELEKIIKIFDLGDVVKFIDYTSDVSKAYADADILVYPAIYEIFGLVPFEAIACGTPVIVTDDCGCGELIKEIDCGYLVQYGDVDGLKNIIHYILDNSNEVKTKVIKGQKFIYQNLAWDKIVLKVEESYENCILNNRQDK